MNRSRVASIRGWRSLAIVLTVGLLAGACSTTRQARSVEPSGFLDRSWELQEGGSGQALLRYENPTADFTKYDAILLDSVAIYAAEDSKLADIDPEQAKLLAAHFQEALTTELGKDYRLVDAPEPKAMRLRVAITEARGSKVVLDSITTIIPQTRLLSTGAQFIGGTSVATGKARAEAELVDSMTGERLLAAVDERFGSKAFRGTFTTWSDAREAFDYWAKTMRARLAEKRGITIEE